ncbi:MAG: Rne/Rng family ribonuclease, partial [Prevotellaceae bacterium]|nr:Rne/Rng family ribonuclease [Prevotellaceae bacterium]
MNSELIVNVEQSEISIALLEDKNLVEISKEGRETSFAVGDIYLGKVRKIMPGLNAAFINIGYEKDAFVHYLDLGNHFPTLNHYIKQITAEKRKALPIQKVLFEKELPKDGAIADILANGQDILVQITKEPISTKGPRLTAEISIAGRNLILIPFSNKISVSHKIKSRAEQKRLQQLIRSVLPKNFGVIVRTAAEGKMVAELDNELKILVKSWDDAILKVSKEPPAPKRVAKEIGRTASILRDIINPDFEAIYVNDRETYEEIFSYVTMISPEHEKIVRLYKNSEVPIFDNFNVTKQLKSSFGRVVSVQNGAYLVIEHTEALHVIDVNSGTRKKQSDEQEASAMEVNLAAAEMIARQLRLRDMGGIIVVDFIDLQQQANRQMLFEKMIEFMQPDRTTHKILPLSKFGLIQITRQRVRPEMRITVTEECPVCEGKGRIQPSLLFTDRLEKELDYIVRQLKIKNIILTVHPFIYAYINQGFFPLKWKWKFRHGFGVKVLPMQSYTLLEYKFTDKDKNQ